MVIAGTYNSAADTYLIRMKRDRRTINRQRFERQFRYFAARLPIMKTLRKPGWMIARLVMGLLLIVGGMLAILPILNIWMIPLGLMLLAIDLPVLQGPVTHGIIRGRRLFERLRRDWFPRQAK